MPEPLGKTAPDPQRLQRLRDVLQQAVARGETPGAVALVCSSEHVFFHQAFGFAQLVPEPDPMALDTLFDLASLTKVVATAPAILLLVESGQICLQEPAVRFLPELHGDGRDAIDVRHLLTHCSGLPAWKPLYQQGDTPEQRLRALFSTPLEYPPGQRFQYSDLGFILLGEIVQRVSGMPLDEFAREHIFAPLEMKETCFRPPATLASRCAATEVRDGIVTRGVVHDENAAALGGVAGHAGLFATAPDLARYCQMLLRHGELGGRQVLSPLSVRAMLSPQSPCPGSARGLGFDIHSAYASIRGDLLPVGSAGHSGFTGTSLWVDRELDVAIVLLTNAVHPSRERNVRSLRARVSNVVAAALPSAAAAVPDRVRDPVQVRTGVDVLLQDGCRLLSGLAVGLITNHTGRCKDGRATLQVLLESGISVRALFSPEHGIRGTFDDAVESGRDDTTGLPVYSLYGKSRAPLSEWLEGLDALVFDIQDIGARFYTYISTLGLCLEAAAQHGLRFIVLDRPNPITGKHIEGPLLLPHLRSFVGHYEIPIRHGLTVGELARLANADLGCDLHVVPVLGWRRSMWWDETCLEWVNPSPAMRTLNAATLYPGLCCLENTNLSVGRGTDTPFEVVGAPWVDPVRLAAELSTRDIPGIGFVPIRFTPQLREYAGETCGGVHCIVTQREHFRPVAMAIHLAEVIHRLHTKEFSFHKMDALVGTERVRFLLERFVPAEEITSEWHADELAFAERRAPYLLYE